MLISYHRMYVIYRDRRLLLYDPINDYEKACLRGVGKLQLD